MRIYYNPNDNIECPFMPNGKSIGSKACKKCKYCYYLWEDSCNIKDSRNIEQRIIDIL